MINAIDFSKWSKPQNNWLSIGNVLILKGKRKVGKSLFAQQLMTAAATGRTWFDEYVGKIKTYGVFCEDDEEKLRHRQSAINEFYQLSMESPDLAHNVRLFPRIREYSLLMTFNDENVSCLTSYFYELLKDIQLFQPRLVVLDSTSSLFWGDENNRFHLEQFITGCCVHIAREANCAVLLCAHDNSEEVGDWNNKVWHLIRRGNMSDKREFYGYGIRRMKCYQNKVFYNAGDHYIGGAS